MRKIICLIKTLWDFDTFWMAWTTFGAVYVAHEYVEWKNTKHTQTLRCEVCGDKSVARYKGINPFWNPRNSKLSSLNTER